MHTTQATNNIDPETAKVYRAENNWVWDFALALDDDDPRDQMLDLWENGDLTPEDAKDVIDTILRRYDELLGNGGDDDRPVVVFKDLSSKKKGAAGYVAGDTEVIYLDPELMDLQVVLHELAHWIIGPSFGHNMYWRKLHVELLGLALGEKAAECLRRDYVEVGLEDAAALPNR
jgi:hypothetical protein